MFDKKDCISIDGQVASSVERPAADGEEAEKANGHAEVQIYRHKC